MDPDLEHATGLYFDGQQERRAHEQAYDPRAREQLRELSERLTGLSTSSPFAGEAQPQPW